MDVQADRVDAVVVTPSIDQWRGLCWALEDAGVTVIGRPATGSELVLECERLRPQAVVLPQRLPDGDAEVWLARLRHKEWKPAVAIVLAYDSPIELRQRVEAVAPGWAEVVFAGGRDLAEVGREVAEQLLALAREKREKERAAVARLAVPGPAGTAPGFTLQRRVIGVVGAGGGAGASLLVASLAAAATAKGRKVVVLDADLHNGPAVGGYLGLHGEEIENKSLWRLRFDLESAADDVDLVLGRIMPDRGEGEYISIPLHRRGGVPVFYMSFAAPAEAAGQVRGEWVVRVAKAVLSARSDVHTVLVDLGSGLYSPAAYSLARSGDYLVTVAAPCPAHLRNLVWFYENEATKLQLASGRFGVVLNRCGLAGNLTARSASRELAAKLGRADILHSFEEHAEVAEDVANLRLTVVSRPDHVFSQQVRSLAAKLGMAEGDVEVVRPQQAKGLLGRLLAR